MLLPNFLLVPARVLEKIQHDKSAGIHDLNNSNVLQRILTESDLFFYKYVNDNVPKFVPKELVGLVQDQYDFLEDVKESDADLFGKTNFKTKEEVITQLARCNVSENMTISGSEGGYTYVSNYFEIDETTVGVVYTKSNCGKSDTVTSFRNLMLLLAREYSSRNIVDGRGLAHDYQISYLCESGLVDGFRQLITTS